jgi:hypothetical protein
MNRATNIGLIAFSFAMALAMASAESTIAPQYGKAELQRMIRQAHTPQEYQVLAGYFRSRQQKFEQQAQAEKEEWQRRSQNVTGPAAKWPRPVDSSKNRYDYFACQANQMAQQAARYESLATHSQ